MPKQMFMAVEELLVAINFATSKEFITFASMGGMTTLGPLLKYQNPEKKGASRNVSLAGVQFCRSFK